MAKKKTKHVALSGQYDGLLSSVSELLEQARRTSARTVNAILTATYWEIGRRIVEFEQKGERRAEYGQALLKRLAVDLSSRFGRGYSRQNLQQMRLFYLAHDVDKICQTVSGKLEGEEKSRTASGFSGLVTIRQTLSAKSEIVQASSSISEKLSRKFTLSDLAQAFPLPWSHYVRLLSVDNPEARNFYEAEAIRGGWSVRQLDRQIATQFYERTALSKNKAAMLKKGEKPDAGEVPTAEEEIKDPYVLEFLGLKDEYSENDLEEALIQHLERFLLELGGDFAFIGRQKRLRIGNEWYRIDLLFFHRKLRCLVVIDLKVGKFTHADAGQMHMYLNYAREHWVNEGENPPVGLILCAEKDSAVAKYSLEGLPNKVLAAEYKLALPDEKKLAREVEETQKRLGSGKKK
jgi:predicted nuclease of restriction endonuclease-like (RecB) superfamily